jgi:hypothetical protein
LPVVFEHYGRRLNYGLLAVGLANLIILAIPGRSIHRALEAYGAFTLLNAALWLINLVGGWKWMRTAKLRKAGD